MKKLEVNKKLLQKVTKSSVSFVLAGTLLFSNNVILFNKDNVNIVQAAEQNSTELDVQSGINL